MTFDWLSNTRFFSQSQNLEVQDRKKNEITFASQLKAALQILRVFSNLTKLYFLTACIFWLLLRVKITNGDIAGLKGLCHEGIAILGQFCD